MSPLLEAQLIKEEEDELRERGERDSEIKSKGKCKSETFLSSLIIHLLCHFIPRVGRLVSSATDLFVQLERSGS